ncbi:ABC transporter permease [Streptomyces sp. PTM05]|uniref:ABC transporter permease n=1 Tax=Streptantibioticus parmotrematis TaxID=2873249 RepID=A0ABS7QZA7_9ACTN|nr:ABC transporter permease [Streptantibioticus parmotrematis]MBY8888546.1 ABC transporter permease [Streptantibioticus parmotrematis]
MSRAEADVATGTDAGAGAPAAGAGPAAETPGTPEGSGTPTASRTARALWSLGLFRGELRIVFRRWRTAALLGVLAAIPVLVGIAVKFQTRGDRQGAGDGPAFIADVTNNGLFLVFTSLAVTLPFFLPMAVGVVAGDSVAGEANAGTLRYLLVAPAGRTRLLLTKYATVLVFCGVATLVVALAALATGAALFPFGDVTLISGQTVSLGDGLLRALAIAGVVAVSLVGIAALGLFVSTLTDSAIAAMATTVGVLLTVQILGAVPQLHAVQPYLFPHYWMSFADLLRAPAIGSAIARNAGLQALYAAVFVSAAWARLTTRDVTA